MKQGVDMLSAYGKGQERIQNSGYRWKLHNKELIVQIYGH